VHEQVLYAQTGAKKATEFRPHSGSAVPLGAQRRWLALVGSVGQPRDGRPAAGYALFDQDQDELTYFRVPYDHLSAARKIRAAGLSEGLAYRVEKGV
jgi:diadenosine tetraphosphatase ApaH/serine/threonine PP2A family protein phosphatase